MIVTLQTERVQTLADVRAVIDGNHRLDYQFTDREAAYEFIRRTLVRFDYPTLSKPDKGVIRRYLAKMYRITFDPALVPRESLHSADQASVTYGGHDRASDIRCCTFSVPGQQWQRSHLRLRYRTLCMASQRLRCRPHRGDGRSDHRASERVSPGGQNRCAARCFSWLSGSLPSLACRVASTLTTVAGVFQSPVSC